MLAYPRQQQPADHTPPLNNANASGLTDRNPWFPKIEHVNRPTVETAAAAYYLNRKQQTLREWACYEEGPIRPLRVHGRLAWPVSEIKHVLGVPA